MNKMKISLPIIVEGRYDKSTLSSIIDAKIITTGGFSLFNSSEKKALIKKLAEKKGIILLTDSDAGGRQIRSFLMGFLPSDKIFNLYIPEVEGKEKRKKTASKEGLLGVEGMTRETLEKLLKPFACKDPCEEKHDIEDRKTITKLDFFSDGLSGGENSQKQREILAKRLDLPKNMSAKAMIDAINLLYSYDEYKAAIASVRENYK